MSINRVVAGQRSALANYYARDALKARGERPFRDARIMPIAHTHCCATGPETAAGQC